MMVMMMVRSEEMPEPGQKAPPRPLTPNQVGADLNGSAPSCQGTEAHGMQKLGDSVFGHFTQV
jgi:hypothetical protein